jgi:hypothetical protein
LFLICFCGCGSDEKRKGGEREEEDMVHVSMRNCDFNFCRMEANAKTVRPGTEGPGNVLWLSWGDPLAEPKPSLSTEYRLWDPRKYRKYCDYHGPDRGRVEHPYTKKRGLNEYTHGDARCCINYTCCRHRQKRKDNRFCPRPGRIQLPGCTRKHWHCWEDPMPWPTRTLVTR